MVLNGIVIKEDTESLTLLIKDVLTLDTIKKIFDIENYDSDGDVKFNVESNNIWWKDSIIRKSLNDKFLKMLNKEDLLPMTSTVWDQGMSSTTKDYVRLLSVEEIFRLPNSILKKDRWFWSFSPYYYYGSYAGVFGVNYYGYLSYHNVNNTGGVAPVIRLKTDALKRSQN